MNYFTQLYSQVYDNMANFSSNLRLKEDAHLIPNTVYQYGRLAYLSKTRRIHLWFDLEYQFKHNKKIAIVFPRPIKGKPYDKYGEDSFQMERYTYNDVYQIVLRLSYILANEYDVKPKDMIAMDFPNGPMFAFVFLALWNLGAIPALINYNLVNEPLIHCIDLVDAAKVFIDEAELGEKLRPCLANGTAKIAKEDIIYFDEATIMQKLLDPNAPIYKTPDEFKLADSSDPALILFTSGTTGMPKGAVNSHKKVFHATHIFPHAMRIDHNSSIYTAMPLYHGTACILAMLPALSLGGTICIGYKFSVSSYWTQVKLCEANTIQYVGEVCRYLVGNKAIQANEDKHKVKLAYGNGLRADIWLEFKRRFGIESIGEFYASSEAPFGTTCFQSGENQAVGAVRNCGFLASIFLSMQYCLLKLDPEDDNILYRDPKTGFCKQPGANEKGEIVMRISNPKNIKGTFPGYYNSEKDTSEKIIRDVFRKGDAYVRSDDIMKYDSKGYLYFVDRLGDTYRWKSENVSTSEVESHLLKIPDIELCVVVGAKVENHEGRAGYAYIKPVDKKHLVFNDNHTENDPNNANKLRFFNTLAKYVTENLPYFARPVFIKFKYDLALTEHHKLAKKPLRNPKLPGEGVYYFDQKNLTYKFLDELEYNKIKRGDIRL